MSGGRPQQHNIQASSQLFRLGLKAAGSNGHAENCKRGWQLGHTQADGHSKEMTTQKAAGGDRRLAMIAIGDDSDDSDDSDR
eukprot:380636-Pelagomonas_calceolata.AAC.8